MRKNFEDFNYKTDLDLIETQKAIKFVKDIFQKKLAKALNLQRVTAPLFVEKHSGLNDGLNGVEAPISFNVPSLDEEEAEIVHSLAKWKRMALNKYHFKVYTGLYTDMNAIRKDEEIDFYHSIYVDQWDWELVINKNDRTYKFLKTIVRKIYKCIYSLEQKVISLYPNLNNNLPKKIYFISTKKLEKMYPHLSRKEREDEITRKYKAVFLYQIGNKLKDGLPHDGRAADYDDWKLNGDILLYYDLYDMAFEISSMGIRVNKESLIEQVTQKQELYKLSNEYCQKIINGTLPLTIGGGIGQSRLCMYMLRKAHIGEVQVSLWKKDYLEKLKKYNIELL